MHFPVVLQQNNFITIKKNSDFKTDGDKVSTKDVKSEQIYSYCLLGSV